MGSFGFVFLSLSLSFLGFSLILFFGIVCYFHFVNSFVCSNYLCMIPLTPCGSFALNQNKKRELLKYVLNEYKLTGFHLSCHPKIHSEANIAPIEFLTHYPPTVPESSVILFDGPVDGKATGTLPHRRRPIDLTPHFHAGRKANRPSFFDRGGCDEGRKGC